MYKLVFTILLVSAAPRAAFGASLDRLGRGPDHAARWADRFGRVWAAGAIKPSVRRSEAVTVKPSTRPAGRRSRKEMKPAVGPQTRRPLAVRTPATSNTAATVGRTRRAARPHAPVSIVFPSGAALTIVKGRDRVGQEHYDPTGSGNPLLNASGANRSKMLTDNFSVGEMARSGDKTFEVARIDPRHVICLQAIRDHVGKPVWVRSGYRSFWYNLEVYRRLGKKPTKSQHISGKASDIWIQGMTGLEVSKAAIDACGPDLAVGVGLEYAHVDVRGYPGVWGYNGVPRRQVAELERYRIARRVALRAGGNRRRRAPTSKRT